MAENKNIDVSFYPEALRHWYKEVEPIPSFRNCKSYPDDWKYRTWFVRLRAKCICQKCGKPEGDYEELDHDSKLHTHHIISLKEGGDNSLGNLIYVCRNCHKKYHPHLACKRDDI